MTSRQFKCVGPLVLFVCLLSTTHVFAQTPATDKSSFSKLNAAIGKVLTDKHLKKTRVGIHVVDMKTGKQLYALKAKEAFNPASNMKLFTAAVALDTFGPSKTVETLVIARDVKDGVARGVAIKGAGDPLLMANHMLHWAYSLKRQGIKSIRGNLIVDEGAFDRQYVPPGFEQKSEDASYRAPVGALSVNFNAVHVHVSPGPKGKAAVVRLKPDNGHVKIVNETVSVDGKKGAIKVVSITEKGGTTIKVTGNMGLGARVVVSRKRIDQPGLFAASVFTRRLKSVGISFKGKVVLGKVVGKQVLIRHQSSALARAVYLMNKWSNNFIAEQLLKIVGGQSTKPATTAAGRQALTAFLKKHKIDLVGFKVLNGSGLYTGNMVTPKQVTDLLMVMSRHKYSAEFKASLPIAGQDGSLRFRLKKSTARDNLRGKTGTLNQVSALSGYVKTAKGRVVAYSIIFNDPPIYAWRLRAQQDKIAKAIAESVE